MNKTLQYYMTGSIIRSYLSILGINALFVLHFSFLPYFPYMPLLQVVFLYLLIQCIHTVKLLKRENLMLDLTSTTEYFDSPIVIKSLERTYNKDTKCTMYSVIIAVGDKTHTLHIDAMTYMKLKNKDLVPKVIQHNNGYVSHIVFTKPHKSFRGFLSKMK